MTLPLALVLLPLAAAALLAAWPARAAALNVAAAALTLLLAVGLLLVEPGPEGAWLAADALNRPLVLVAALVGLSTAIFSFDDIRAEGFDTGATRLYHACFQGFVAAQMLALLADNLGLMWVAIEAATLLCILVVGMRRTPAAMEAAWKFFILCGIGIALALFGVILLAMAAQPLVEEVRRLSFAAILAAAPRTEAGLLNLAFLFLLVGFGTKAGLVPLHSWLPDAHAEGPTPIAAVLSGLLLNCAMLGILRGLAIVNAHDAAIAPGPFLIAAGLASLLLASLSLWRRRDAKRLFGWSSIEHLGLSAFAFGLGGPAGHMAGMVHLCGHALLKSAAFFALGRAAQLRGSQAIADISGLARSHPALGWGLIFAMAGLAGLPPFALFVSELLMAATAGREAPWLLLPLLVGLLVAGLAILAAMQRMGFGPPHPGPAAGVATLLPLWAHLLLAAVLGFALPEPLAALFRDAARLLG
ncbi:proton-conducting transporter transmembrane domain-containing protein [Sabulicella rubraurantiaca]|uniref:proton-conducting transporter transmembrane domain-containing protein n=1 Tax=Sabulicella rubraurantiaca TaxID=2811429 RepID=UPI002E29B98C|nr:proton-conducting transporter membrane subunit [Sabulicella rubraurantiaca]